MWNFESQVRKDTMYQTDVVTELISNVLQKIGLTGPCRTDKGERGSR